MVSLHIVCRYKSISMLRMTQPLMQSEAMAKLFTVTCSEEPDPAADINYHVPWHTLVGLEKGKSKHVMLYTHCNPPD